MKEVDAMVEFILQELRRHGVAVPDAIGTAAMVAVHRHYGGERVYVPKLPKLQSAVRLRAAAPEAGEDPEKLALATGLSVRHIRRLQRGR